MRLLPQLALVPVLALLLPKRTKPVHTMPDKATSNSSPTTTLFLSAGCLWVLMLLLLPPLPPMLLLPPPRAADGEVVEVGSSGSTACLRRESIIFDVLKPQVQWVCSSSSVCARASAPVENGAKGKKLTIEPHTSG